MLVKLFSLPVHSQELLGNVVIIVEHNNKTNKTLRSTAIPLRFIAVGELGRYAAQNSSSKAMQSLSVTRIHR